MKKEGQVFTKKEVSVFMLDVIEYQVGRKLVDKSILEPSIGNGVFFMEMVKRLINDYKKQTSDHFSMIKDEEGFNHLKDCIRGIEIDSLLVEQVREKVANLLTGEGFSNSLAEKLSEKWIIHANFLFWNTDYKRSFDYIVGNPPYIRTENIEDMELKRYKKLYKTMFDRADIYIGFIEHGLKMLRQEGILSYISTDRFIKNTYGRRIRELISKEYAVRFFIDIHETDPFEENVMTYPCIYGITKKSVSETLCFTSKTVEQEELKVIKQKILENKLNKNENVEVVKLADWFKGDSPWLINLNVSNILRKIQTKHLPIKKNPGGVKCKVGIATAAKKILLVTKADVRKYNLEEECLIPVITREHLKESGIEWDGTYLINTFDSRNIPISLEDHPNLKKYLLKHREELSKRAFIKKPDNWFLLKEKVRISEIKMPKVVFPDIAKKPKLYLESGRFYPEHSLYYLIPGAWDPLTLLIILESPVGMAFVKSYSTNMRGGYVRYQKQNVEMICLPRNLNPDEEKSMQDAWKVKDKKKLNEIIRKIYGLRTSEMEILNNYIE